MNYKLCKKLKDAGFPQMVAGGGYFLDPDHEVHGEQITFRGDVVYVPTLSELIEACGEDFDLIRREELESWLGGTRWCCMGNPDDYGINQYYGSTPEESVANLWLALNKK